MFSRSLSPRTLLYFELFIGVVFCFAPLFFNNPYRINIFLSWEGAYRISEGQMPFRDFSLPMGYGYWLIPALFFKVFGPFMYSLIKAQVMLNLLSLLAFRWILALLKIRPEIILYSVLVFCLSYVSKNFWPWYNHSVVVFELIGLGLILFAILNAQGWKVWASLIGGAFFVFLSFFTKQDIGGLAVLISLFILGYDAWQSRSFKKIIIYLGSLIIISSLVILPILRYDFLYWFNYGQPPHESRLVLRDFLNQWLGWTYWEKFFLLVIVLVLIDRYRDVKEFITNREEFLFTVLCTAMILQGMVVQVTSPVPPENESFFYAFGFVFVLSRWKLTRPFDTILHVGFVSMLIVFWWSGIYWRNIQRFVSSKPAVVEKIEKEKPSRYRLAKEFKTMEKLYLSAETINGIHRVMELDVVKNKTGMRVLNMTELTSLAYEMSFEPPTKQPMWYHQDVAIFEKEIEMLCKRVSQGEFDLVLFESIPHQEAVNFNPDAVKECLDEYYLYEFSFLAPRTPEESFIHVYTKK